eukprot:m.243684 g.243684  ORF g.243684 m.243684 type:complete len:106 (+) comp40238_c0_seq79:1252-1569(+)
MLQGFLFYRKFVCQLQMISSELDMAIKTPPGKVEYGRSVNDANRLFHAAKSQVRGLNLIFVVHLLTNLYIVRLRGLGIWSVALQRSSSNQGMLKSAVLRFSPMSI